MTADPPTSFARNYAGFVAVCAGAAGLVAAVGYLPTARLAADGGVAAMFAACAIVLVAMILGAIPVCAAIPKAPPVRTNAVLLSMALRMMLVLLMALSAALSGLFARTPLLVWVAICYVVCLAVDTAYSVHVMGSHQTGPAGAKR